MKTTSVLVIVVTSLLWSIVTAQVGYFESCSQYMENKPIEFESCAWKSSAFGSSLKFYNGKKKTKVDTKKIIGFVNHGRYYRYFKYATTNVLMKGPISLYGLVPTTLEIDEEKQVLEFRRTSYIGGLPSYMSEGECGKLISLNRKNLSAALQSDPELLELFETKKLQELEAILLFNIKYDDGTGFIEDGDKKISWEQFAEILSD